MKKHKGRSPLGGIFRAERNIPLRRNRAERKSNLHYKKRSIESAGNMSGNPPYFNVFILLSSFLLLQYQHI